MSYVALAWIGLIIYATVVIINKLASKYSIKNPWFFNFLYNGSTVFFTIPVALYNHATVPTHWTNIILTGFFFASSSFLYVLATYLLDVTVLSPLFNLRTAFAVILAFFLIHEKLTSVEYLYIAVIFCAGIFATVDEKFSASSFFKKSTVVGILCMISLAFMGVFTNKAIAESGFWNATIWSMIISQILLVPTIPFFFKDIKKITPTPIFIMTGVGVLETVAAIIMNAAYAVNVSITSVIISLPLSMVLAILFSFFAPKLLEKHSVKVYAIRLTAAAVMIFAALHLS